MELSCATTAESQCAGTKRHQASCGRFGHGNQIDGDIVKSHVYYGAAPDAQGNFIECETRRSRIGARKRSGAVSLKRKKHTRSASRHTQLKVMLERISKLMRSTCRTDP